jgi:membrane-associated phospholipid phosphatase
MTAARRTLMLGIVAFAVLATTVLLFPTFPTELTIRNALMQLDVGIGAVVLRVVDQAGTWRVILPAALLVFFLSREARARWWVWTIALLTAPAAETFFKEVIARPRPEAITMGFPSGHATAAAAFFGSVIYLAAPFPGAARVAVRTLAVAVILLVGVSRVALGAHWPTDALAGIALGISLASAARLLASGSVRPSTAIRGPFRGPHVKPVDSALRRPPS